MGRKLNERQNIKGNLSNVGYNFQVKNMIVLGVTQFLQNLAGRPYPENRVSVATKIHSPVCRVTMYLLTISRRAKLLNVTVVDCSKSFLITVLTTAFEQHNLKCYAR